MVLQSTNMSSALVPVIYEDNDFIIVSKPPGLLTIPGRDLNEPSLLKTLSKKHSGLLTVHRIDRETSGLVLFAKNPESHKLACSWFEKHEIRKSYVALVQGEPMLPSFRVQKPIEGKACLSLIKVSKRWRDVFLADVEIATGRRHQIRIHLSEEGFPVLGDTQYGGEKKYGVNRVALHAHTLVLPDKRKFEAPLPEDFLSWMKQLDEECA